jgi:hypothetical protein
MNPTTGCDCRSCQASTRIAELREIMDRARDSGQPVPQAVRHLEAAGKCQTHHWDDIPDMVREIKQIITCDNGQAGLLKYIEIRALS